MVKHHKLAQSIPNLPFEWKNDGLCKTSDFRIFFSDVRDEVKQALQICNKCKVKQDCFDYAMANNEHGVWGGTTEHQRRMMVRRLNYERKKVSFYGSTVT